MAISILETLQCTQRARHTPTALPFPNWRWMEETSRANAHHLHISIWPQGSSSSHPAWVSLEASSSNHSSTVLVSKAKTTYYFVQLEVS